MIVERDEMLSTIKDRLDQAAQGTGTFILLGGEAGSGKTTVVREVVARWGSTLTVVEGACDPLTTARPLGPLLEIATHPELRLRHLLDEDRPAAELTAALVDELAMLSDVVLVVVEDLHWADDGTLDMIRFLARRVERTGAVVVATYRSDEVVDGHRLVPVLGQVRRMGSTVHLEAAPLSVAAVRSLAGEANARLDPELLHRRTGGNAFFVTEVLAAETSVVDVPGNVQAAVLARIAGLGPEARRLVEATAVSPRALEYDHALALSAADDHAVDEAVAAGVLSLGRGRFEFRHELARIAVERSTPPGRRRRYHRALVERLLSVAGIGSGEGGANEGPAGREPAAGNVFDGPVLDVSRLAHHAIALGDERLVLHYGTQAADNAEARGSYRQACQFLIHVLQFAGTVPPQQVTEWRIRLGSLLRSIGDFRPAIDELERAAADCRRRSDHARLSHSLRLLSSAHRDVGQRTTAEELGERAVAAAEASGDAVVLADALIHRAFLAMLARRTATAVDLATSGLELAGRSGERSAIANAEHALACANLIGGDEDAAIARLTGLEEQAAEQGAIVRRIWLAVNLGSGCGEIRRYRESVPWLEAAERLALTVDMDQVAAYAAAWLARVAFETGRWNDVSGHFRRAVGEFESIVDTVDGTAVGSSFAEVTALGALGRARVRRGDPGGREILVKAMELAADHDFQYLWPVACGLAEEALWRGDLDAGLTWLAPIHTQAMETGSAWGRGETSFWMARLGALDVSAPDSSALDPIAEPFALALTGQWSAASAVWEARGCPYEQSLALLDSGEAEAIGRAVAILDDLGARPAAQLGRQQLRELGERSIPALPRASTASNPASLTNRQREVLELLIDGASNRDIAERLFVSKKTVEHHVSAVYTKLDVPDRPSAMVAGRRLLRGGSTPS